MLVVGAVAAPEIFKDSFSARMPGIQELKVLEIFGHVRVTIPEGQFSPRYFVNTGVLFSLTLLANFDTTPSKSKLPK